MKVKTRDIIWGIFLIVLGAIVLAQQLDWLTVSDTLSLVIVLTILTLVAPVGYIAGAWRNCGFLSPAAGMGGSALAVWLVEEDGKSLDSTGFIWLSFFYICRSVPEASPYPTTFFLNHSPAYG